MTNDKDTGLKWLSLDAIHAHCRIDFNCEDAELKQMGITAEQAILDLTRRTYENFIDTYGRIPDSIFNASLLLVQNLYNNRDAADTQKKEAALYGFDLLLKNYMVLTGGTPLEVERDGLLDKLTVVMTEFDFDFGEISEPSEELVEAYKTYIEQLNPQVSFPYSHLGQFCANCDEMRKSYRDAARFDMIVEVLQSMDVEMERQDESNYKARVDAVLINLISNYDPEELSLRTQQAYYRYIVDNSGDMEVAEQQFEEEQRLKNERFNIGKQFIGWAVYDDNEETDVHVRKFAMRNTRQWFRGALDKWDVEIQDRHPLNFNLSIDTWQGTSNGDDQADQITAMKNYFENNKFQNMYVNTPNIAAAIILILSLGLAFVTIYSLIATILAAGFLVYRVLKAMKEYPLRVNAALENLNKCMEEISKSTQFARKKRNRSLKIMKISILLFFIVVFVIAHT